jgi:DNA-binding NarL/FixJ family response regulator
VIPLNEPTAYGNLNPLPFTENPIIERPKVTEVADSGHEALGGVQLSKREMQVLVLICDGLSVKELASALQISPKTVEFHKHGLCKKLQIYTTAMLVRYAIRMGVISA